MQKIVLIGLFIVLINSLLSAQFGPNSIGTWKALIPYQSGLALTETQENILYVSDHGILEISKEDLSLSFVSKVEGLSGSQPQFIEYNKRTKGILLNYKDSDIDLIIDGSVINAPFIKNANNINGSKNINKLVSFDEFIYILADFGVVKFDMKKLEVTTTLKTEFPIYDMVMFNNQYVLATAEGLIGLDLISSVLEFGFIDIWEQLTDDEGLLFDGKINSILNYKNNLLIGSDFGQLIEIDVLGTRDTLIDARDSSLTFLDLDNGDGYFYILNCPDLKCRGEVVHVDSNGNKTFLPRGVVDRPTMVLQDDQGRVWCGDLYSEFRWLEEIGGESQRISTNTPKHGTVYDLEFVNDEVWMVTGSYELNNVVKFRFIPTTYMTNIDGEWSSASWEKSNTILNDNNLGVMHNLSYDEKRDKLYLASFLDGLLEISGEDQIVYNHENENLGPNTGDIGRTMVFDVEVADNGDVWMSNYNAEFPIRVKRNNGEWEKYKAAGRKELTDLVIDDFGNKWYVDNSTINALVVFNDHGTATTSDDDLRTFSTSNSNFPSNTATFMVKDLDGAIWVGMNIGVMVFDCGGSVFSNDCNGFRPVINVDGLPENLLNDERVTAIDVDGGNRKWFGTTSGVFVHSPDGQDQVYNYNEDNSPLFSNSISTININRKSGEVYIGTLEGLNMIQTDARQGEEFHQPKIYVYPNPVEPNYTGPIAFNGFAQDSDFRITDISGRLVYRSKSVGGQAIWYGNDVYGNRVKSGVYLIWGATEQLVTSTGVVGKVVIISE